MLEQGAKTGQFRAVPAAIFIFDCARLLFLIALLSIFLKTGPGFGVINLPMMMFAAPNALFPLMAFFLLIRGSGSGAYVPLYIVGKALCMLCVLVWMLFSLMQERGFLVFQITWLAFLFLCAADLGTIMGTALSLPLEVIPPEAIPAEPVAQTEQVSADTVSDDVKIIPGGG